MDTDILTQKDTVCTFFPFPFPVHSCYSLSLFLSKSLTGDVRMHTVRDPGRETGERERESDRGHRRRDGNAKVADGVMEKTRSKVTSMIEDEMKRRMWWWMTATVGRTETVVRTATVRAAWWSCGEDGGGDGEDECCDGEGGGNGEREMGREEDDGRNRKGRRGVKIPSCPFVNYCFAISVGICVNCFAIGVWYLCEKTC